MKVDTLNKAGGIFIHNKATMDIEVKDLLIGISRVYVDCNNNLNSYIYNEEISSDKNLKTDMDLEQDLNTHMDLKRKIKFTYRFKK